MDNETNFSEEPNRSAPPQPSGDAAPTPIGQPAQQPAVSAMAVADAAISVVGGVGKAAARRRPAAEPSLKPKPPGCSQRRDAAKALSGPMDHNYRQGSGENGNSTSQNRGNGQGQPKTATARVDADVPRFGRAGGGGGSNSAVMEISAQQRPSNFAYTRWSLSDQCRRAFAHLRLR